MLEELAKKDSKWREIALKICKSKDLADEIVNRMYLRLYDRNPDKDKLTDYYVVATIRNLFIDHCKERKHVSIESLYYLEDEQTDKTFNDEELSLIVKASKDLKWWQQQLLVESYDKSLRQIQKEFNINYQFVRRHTEKSRKIVLGKDYKPKKSKNGKRTA